MAEINILQPKDCNFDEIQHQITQSANQIIDIATYPNGFVVKLVSTAGEIKVETNRPLIKIDETTYQIPD